MLGPGVHASRINVICVHGLIGGIGYGACSSLPALADEAYALARARLSESWCNISLDAIVGGSSGQHVELGVEGCKVHARDRSRGACSSLLHKGLVQGQCRLVSGLLHVDTSHARKVQYQRAQETSCTLQV